MATNTTDNDSSNYRTEGPIPPPSVDPTAASSAAIEKAARAERDYVNGQMGILIERLNGIDRATKLLSDTVNRVPTEVTKEVSRLKGLVEEKLKSIDKQFEERDTRSERESRDNKVAVDAAFAAQKEAASEQNKSNTLAIDKSEKATAETLNKQADLFKSTTDALGAQIDDLKLAVGSITSTKVGGTAATANIVTLVLLAIAVIGFGITLLSRN